ncbi:MAG TPA: DUF2062 domain-containing protein [Planctomycetota bacterium]|jgi:cardiolipin synthase
MLYRSRVRIRRLARKVLHSDDTPERIARGIAAGFFACAFPLPGLQIPLSLLCAWLVRGNKIVAVIPQFISNGLTMPLITYGQLWLGTRLWPGSSANLNQSWSVLSAVAVNWSWLEPGHSVRALLDALTALGSGVVIPLSIGVFLTACVSASLSYPLTLVGMVYLQSRRLRRRLERGIPLHSPRGQFLLPPDPLPGEALDAEAVLRYTTRKAHFVHAESVTLLVDGKQAYPEMLRCIDEAVFSIDMETYILHADQTGTRFAAALGRAARRGVKVRLTFDGFGALGLPQAYVDGLLLDGVRVAVYRPFHMLWKLGFGPMNRRNHRKTLVIDGRISFSGGLNIGDEYAAKEQGGAGWRDTHVRVDGPEPARELQQLMKQTWRKCQEFRPPSSGPAQVALAAAVKTLPSLGVLPATCENVSVQILSNREFLQRVRVRRAYLHAIRNAKRYVLIENAYFIPDRGIRRALRQAVKRGVMVGVVVAMYSDVQIAAMASRALYGELLSSGVRLFEYPIAMLHSKAAVIDDVWAVVSSYNLDHRSLRHNLEAGVFIMDRSFAHALRDQILADIRKCREVTPQFHAARAWNQALLESLSYQARYWL